MNKSSTLIQVFHYDLQTYLPILTLIPFMHNVEKWSNVHQESCSVNTARFLMYV